MQVSHLVSSAPTLMQVVNIGPGSPAFGGHRFMVPRTQRQAFLRVAANSQTFVLLLGGAMHAAVTQLFMLLSLLQSSGTQSPPGPPGVFAGEHAKKRQVSPKRTRAKRRYLYATGETYWGVGV